MISWCINYFKEVKDNLEKEYIDSFSFLYNTEKLQKGPQAENFIEAMTSDYTYYNGLLQILFHLFSFTQIGWIFLTEYLWFQIFKNSNSNSNSNTKLYSNSIKSIGKRLTKVNILYVKLFQALALNKELISLDLNNELLEFTDHAPYHSNEIDFKLLDSILYKNNLILDKLEPINSGMISLVFQARQFCTSKKFIIKMKRIGIEITLQNAIGHLLFFLKIVNWASNQKWLSDFFYLPIENLKKYKIDQLVEKNIEMIQQQTNFEEEVKNMQLIKKNCANLKYIVIPEVNVEVTYYFKDAILMEYIDGKTIQSIEKEDRVGFAKSVLKFGFVTSFIHGITHGDLHCGNILFIKDENDDQYPYKIGILDFGILYHLESHFRNSLLDCITDLMERPAEESAYMILQSGMIVNSNNQCLNVSSDLDENSEKEIIEILTNIIRKVLYDSKEANQYQLYYFLKEFDRVIAKNDLLNENLKISDQYVKLQLVLAMAHGVTMDLCDQNYVDLANEVVQDLFRPSFYSIDSESVE